MYSYLYQNTDKHYTILHALDGYDEIALTGATKVVSNTSEYMITPDDFGVKTLTQEAIHGGPTIDSSAKIFTHILNGHGTEAQNNVVCANAAVAISTATRKPIIESFELAKVSLFEGKAKSSFETLVTLSRASS